MKSVNSVGVGLNGASELCDTTENEVNMEGIVIRCLHEELNVSLQQSTFNQCDINRIKHIIRDIVDAENSMKEANDQLVECNRNLISEINDLSIRNARDNSFVTQEDLESDYYVG